MPTQHGPWLINSKETKYKNPWIEVVENKVTRPNGKPGIYATIRVNNGNAVAVLPVDENLNCYLIDEFQFTLGDRTIEPMAGGVEEGEEVFEAAKRELKEELGITAKNWLELGFVDESSAKFYSRIHLFLVQDLEFGENNLDDTETLKMVKMPLSEVVNLVLENKTTWAPGCVLILKAAKKLEFTI